MMRGRSITLYIPVDRDGLEIVYRKYILQNVDITSVTKGEITLYVFYDKVRFLLEGKRVQPFKLREGSFVALGESAASDEELTVGLIDKRAMRVTEATHFISGSLRVHHTRLILK